MVFSQRFSGLFRISEGSKVLFATQNSTPGKTVGQERILHVDGKEYRVIDPRVSKLGAALQKGLKNFPLDTKDVVLYLGASAGTTVSHFSDILDKGFVFAVESGRRMCTQLVFLAQQRSNIAPLFADAAQPHVYAKTLCQVDVLYQDVSQRNQVEIFLSNARLFLKQGGHAFLCIKARSIDVRKDPKQVFQESIALIQKELRVVEQVDLSPFQKDHLFVVCEKI